MAAQGSFTTALEGEGSAVLTKRVPQRSEDCLSDWGTEQGLIERDKKKPRPTKAGASDGTAKTYLPAASTNQLVMLVGCVMAVPTTTAQAPASIAARASSGVCTRPSQMMGRPGNSSVA